MNQEHAAWPRKREAEGKGPCLSDHSSGPSILDDIKSVDVDSDYKSEDSEGVYEVIEDTADRVQAQIDDHNSGAKKPEIDQFLKEFQATRANTAGAYADITVPNKSLCEAQDSSEIQFDGTIHWQSSILLTNDKHSWWKEIVQKSPAIQQQPNLDFIEEKHVMHVLA